MLITDFVNDEIAGTCRITKVERCRGQRKNCFIPKLCLRSLPQKAMSSSPWFLSFCQCWLRSYCLCFSKIFSKLVLWLRYLNYFSDIWLKYLYFLHYFTKNTNYVIHVLYPKACCSVLGLPLTWPGIIAKLYPCLLKSCLILYEAPLPVPISFLKASSIVWAFTSSLAKSEEVVLVGPLSSNMYSQRSAQQFMIQKKNCWTVNVCSLFCVLLNKKEADLQLKSRRVGVLKTLLLTVWKWRKFSLTLYCQKFRERNKFLYSWFHGKNFQGE